MSKYVDGGESDRTRIFIVGEGDYKYGMGEFKEEPWDVGFELEISTAGYSK